MKTLALNILLVCACFFSQAQTNFVKNPSFERFSRCPDFPGTIFFADGWRNPLDSTADGGSDYHNACADTGIYYYSRVPDNNMFFQHAHSGDALVTAGMYFDKTVPVPPPYTGVDYREYIQGHLIKPLIAGKNYCLSFWVNLADRSAYAHNKIGAYVDNGDINALPLPVGSEITSIFPTVFTIDIVKDTANWTLIEGSFNATGNETYVTIGNFAKNEKTDTLYFGPIGFPYYSYYLVDDVSIVESDLKAYAGPDIKIPVGKAGELGRVGDTTAEAIDCKWYHQGKLTDSGAVIIVNGSSVVGTVDTYVVVQTICGNATRDTALVTTVPVGINELQPDIYFYVYPNPSNGRFTVSGPENAGIVYKLRAYDLTSRLQEVKSISNFTTPINLNLPSGTYILELEDQLGNKGRQRIIIR